MTSKIEVGLCSSGLMGGDDEDDGAGDVCAARFHCDGDDIL